MRRRLDAELVRRGLAASTDQASGMIDDHRVLVDGAFALKAGHMVAPGQTVSLSPEAPRYVSRAGLKLEGALDSFRLDVTGCRCLDVGSSTGGFTDCLLQRGAASVLAVDVGTNQLHERLRADPRVTVREQTDIRILEPIDPTTRFDVITVDVSFISLRLVIPALVSLLGPEGEVIALIKPQFEAERDEASRGRGIIRDPEIWSRVLNDVIDEAKRASLVLAGLVPSPITGGGGNVEFVARLRASSPTISQGERSQGEGSQGEGSQPEGSQREVGAGSSPVLDAEVWVAQAVANAAGVAG